MFNESAEAGVGVVVRDSRGLVVAAMSKKIIKPHSMECLELLTARHVVIFAKETGLQQSHFEGDSEIVIKGLQEGGMHFDVHEIYTIKYSHIYIFSLTFMLFCD